MNPYPKILRSVSTRSSNSDRELNVASNQSTFSSLRRLTIPIYPNQQILKKTFSLILNNAASEMCNTPDEHEMHEFIPYTNSDENLNTIRTSELNTSERTIINQQPYSTHTNHPTSTLPHRHCLSMRHTFAHLRNKIKPCRSVHIDDDEKNRGYIFVDNIDSELILRTDDSLDQLATRHAQPCVQINDLNFDSNQIQYESAMTVSSNIFSAAPSQPFLGLSRILDEKNYGLDLQSTRSGIECAIPRTDLLNLNDFQLSEAITTSPSTNSSHHQYSDVDRSLLNDMEYVEAQKLDLERLTILEIRLSEERQYLQSDLEAEVEFNDCYAQALRTNLILKDELQQLKEEYDHIHSSWSCKSCSCDNEPYSITHMDICSTCESPSPLKEARLMK
ncbi:hypothetical protein I4U23_014396 [Adineta vaga]|nr:hypothetical protein I4U23_014396 [Adineta vaga]